MKFTRTGDIAMLSMTLDWKGNLKLIGSCLLGAVIFFVTLLVLMLLAMVAIPVALVAVGVPAALTVNAVLFYADDTGWKTAIVGVVCFFGACFFAYARDQMPRRFFNVLARGAFWLLAIIAFIISAAGFTYLTEAYGELMVFGILSLLPLTCAFLSYWWHRKDERPKNTGPDTHEDHEE